MKAKGCLVAVAVALGLFTVVLALTGPTLMREGARLYKPIAEMESAQVAFEAWSEEHKFSEPAEATATEAQLDAFLDLRRRLAEVDEKNPLPVEGTPRNQRPNLAEIGGLLEGVGGTVTGRMTAYREIGMPPDEYRYLERLVYRLWLRPLRAKGLDPAAATRAAREVFSLASSEKDSAIANRLTRLARNMAERRVPAPEGIPPGLHLLLLARAAEIDALIDAGSSIPTPGGRSSIDF